MGESRQELLAWMNDLLQLNVTRVEQCGSGAALCQVYDSIFLDVPLNRVKFNAHTEYEYLNNLKILQNTFTKHAIDRPVPIQSLVKCKMQDNLEFLQWTKRFWDQHFPGIEYDPIARRGATGPAAPPAPASSGIRAAKPATARRPIASNTAAPRVGPRSGSALGGGGAVVELRKELDAQREAVIGLERERDFYFQKLRDIEVMLQQEVETHPELGKDEQDLIPKLQAILYSTEEGFEIPQDDGADEMGVAAEEETF